MKKTLITFFSTCFCCIFLILLLFKSKECIQLSSNGLLIWYRNMIPSLFPFMVLSGFLIRSGLSVKIGQWLHPLLGSLFRLPPQMLYAIFMGFLCGFPMGAKLVSDMLEQKQITKKEGAYLLAFCNNIGPLYILGYVIPLFNPRDSWSILAWMYLVPLGYGLFLRYLFPNYFFSYNSTKRIYSQLIRKPSDSQTTHSPSITMCSFQKDKHNSPNYLGCFQQSLSSAIEQITMLGGCMVFFNCLLIFPEVLNHFVLQTATTSYSSLLFSILSSLIEIGGGLQQLASISSNTSFPSTLIYLPLSLLTFGGLSCITQTCFILKNTGLKSSTYIKHKLIQSCIFVFLMLLFIFL